jgi:sortase A
MRKRLRRTKSRIRRWLERLLLAVGLLGVGVWVWSTVRVAIYQDWENSVFESELRGQQHTLTGYLREKKDQVAALVRRRLSRTQSDQTQSADSATGRAGQVPTESSGAISQNPTDRQLIGRLIIPRLHLSAMVREGVGEDTLRIALGHIPGTALPGQTGNIGVAGHRDTLFRRLQGIQSNDLIRLETVNGSYLYRVRKVAVVSPQKVSVLNAGLYPELTLVTCFPFYYVGSAPDRFIVTARQVSGDSQEDKVPENQAQLAAQAKSRPFGAGDHKAAAARRVPFEVIASHSRQLTPGISIGLTQTDVADRRADGWIWVMPDRRTIWLRGQGIHQPLIFYGHKDGKMRELVISKISRDSMAGYLLLP